MASDPTGSRGGSPVELFRFTGYVLIVLAGFVGFFHASIWMKNAGGETFNALFGALGALLLTGALPLFTILIARGWRESEYTRLERIASELNERLHRPTLDMPRRDVVYNMIIVYGHACNVSERVGRYLVLTLTLSILVCALYVDKLAGEQIFTRNQGNLLVVFMLLASFAFWCLIWPEDTSRAERFDPSDIIAGALR